MSECGLSLTGIFPCKETISDSVLIQETISDSVLTRENMGQRKTPVFWHILRIVIFVIDSYVKQIVVYLTSVSLYHWRLLRITSF